MLPPFARLPAGPESTRTIFHRTRKRRAAWSAPPGWSVEGCSFCFWWKSFEWFSVEQLARYLFAAHWNPNPIARGSTGLALPAEAAQGDAVGGAAIDGVERINRLGRGNFLVAGGQ